MLLDVDGVAGEEDVECHNVDARRRLPSTVVRSPMKTR